MKKFEVVKSIYGDFTVTEPILLDLINSAAVQRLKGVYQFGITHYVQKFAPYTRYEHSIGVFALLRRYGCSLEEQISGLLHDASHTVFSHVADYLFGSDSAKNSYQDTIHHWFLEKTDVPQIIAKYGYTLDDFMHKSGSFMALEQDLPNLCADRIEYTLYEYAMSLGLENSELVKYKIEHFLQHLYFDGIKWYFDDNRVAREYANLALIFTKERWASDKAMYTYTMAARMLQRALDIGLIDYDTIHFGTDDVVWEKLKNSTDQELQDYLDKVCHCVNAYRLSGINDYNLHLKGKFRGVDPYVKTIEGLRLLSELDDQFAKEFYLLKELVQQGVYIKNLM